MHLPNDNLQNIKYVLKRYLFIYLVLQIKWLFKNTNILTKIDTYIRKPIEN